MNTLFNIYFDCLKDRGFCVVPCGLVSDLVSLAASEGVALSLGNVFGGRVQFVALA